MTRIEFWKDNVKPAAEECYLDQEAKKLYVKVIEGRKLTKEEIKLYDEKKKQYKDLSMAYDIELMIREADEDLLRSKGFYNSTERIWKIYSTLLKRQYFTECFGEERESKCYQNLIVLRVLLESFFDCHYY